MFVSTYKREGESVLVAAGAVQSGTALECGVLFVMSDLGEQAFKLRDVETKKIIAVQLPKVLQNASKNSAHYDVKLEVL